MARRSPLHDQHAALGARFVDFGGWEMPVQYDSVLAEHQAVREQAGVFDVSHLGRMSLGGEGAAELLRGQLCNDIDKIEPGRTQYTMALNENGGIVDDIVVWRWEEEQFWVLPNAANYDQIVARFEQAAPSGIEIERLQEKTVMLAVQGPDAPKVLDRVLGGHPGRFRTWAGEFAGAPVWAAGTGYTGERGGEVCTPAEVGAGLLAAIVEAGAKPAGLGCRDTLRLEAGLPLWGQDLDEETTPLEAGLDWAVSFGRRFVGAAALEEQRRRGLGKKLVAFSLEGRQIPRHGYRLRAGGSEGSVASGNFSPTLGHGIGLGYLAPPESDAPIEVEMRGQWVSAERVDPPFLKRS